MKRIANSQHRMLLAKLQALAERGINGEKSNAKKKIRSLKSRYDFGKPDPDACKDIFAGIFYKSTSAIPILKLADFETLNAIKWAIETTTGIECVFKHDELLANATPGSAKSLQEISASVAQNFGALWTKFMDAGQNPADKKFFIMGLFDGMMDSKIKSGEQLPFRSDAFKKTKLKKIKATTSAQSISTHPYSIAINLGKQIRFCVPLEEISNELERKIQRKIVEFNPKQP